jgi:hypothetical protein
MMRSSAAPEKPLNIRNDSGERMAIIWFARQCLGVNDELSALRALQRRRKRGLDACLAEAREGEEGTIAPFELQFVHLSMDEDGEFYGSSAVAVKDPQALAKMAESTARLPKAAQVALRALHESIDDLAKRTRRVRAFPQTQKP